MLLVLLAFGAMGLLYFSFEIDTSRAATLNASDNAGIQNCNANLQPGDTCSVAAGTYTNQIRPARSGTASARIIYVCPSQNCTIKPTSGRSLDLVERSYITIDGFKFENGEVWGWGIEWGTQQSIGNILANIIFQDTDSAAPYAYFRTQCGQDNELKDSTFYIQDDGINTGSAPFLIGNEGTNCQSATKGYRELRTKVTNSRIGGTGDTIQIQQCFDCVFDGVIVDSTRLHTFTLAGKQAGIDNFTFKNGAIFASNFHREVGIFTAQCGAQSIKNVKLINNFFNGLSLPAVGHEDCLAGTWTIRNNVMANYGSGSGEFLVSIADSNSVNWDINYNAYVQAGNFGTIAPAWRDSRDPPAGSDARDCSDAISECFYADKDNDGSYTDSTCTGDGCDLDDWQALGFDANSIVIANKDYRFSTAGYASQVFGTTGATWGGIIRGQCDTDAIPNNEIGIYNTWHEGFAAGDKIEYNRDGVLRTITGTSGTCGTYPQITFDPPTATTLQYWILAWGKQDPNNDGVTDLTGPITESKRTAFIPALGSSIIDAGDPNSANCGHTPNGRCDIGPNEFGGSGPPDTQAPTVPTNLQATPVP